TRGVAENRVLAVANAEATDVVHRELLADRLCGRAADLDLAHVTHVEETAALANGDVLLGGTPVRERHLPAREGDQAGAGRPVDVEQGRPPCAGQGVRQPARSRRVPPPRPCWRGAWRPSSDRPRREPA